MSQASTAAGIVRSIAHGPAWHGDAVTKILDGVSAEQASARPIPGAHTIWELVAHMTAWQEYAIDALSGPDAGLLEGDADWPPVTASNDGAWNECVAQFRETADRFAKAIGELDDARLSENLTGSDFSVKVLAHGVAHHACYHSGQIALLLKAQSSNSA